MTWSGRIAGLCAGLLLSFTLRAEVLWLDVRTAQEKAQNGIAEDHLVPYDDVVTQVQALVQDKQAPIALYCRSGRRAGIAKSLLEEAGYLNVRNAGSVENARQERGLPTPPCC